MTVETFWVEIDRFPRTTANMNILLRNVREKLWSRIAEARFASDHEKRERLSFGYWNGLDFRFEISQTRSPAYIKLALAGDSSLTEEEASRHAPLVEDYVVYAELPEARAVEFKMRFL